MNIPSRAQGPTGDSHDPLSVGEQDALRRAFGVLLAPLDSVDTTSWRLEVAAALTALFGADRACFQLPVPKTQVLCSQDYPKAVLDAYLNHYQALDLGRIRRDELGVSVWNRHLLHGSELDRFYESEIHQDFLRPNHIMDSMGLTVKLPGSATAATLFLHSERQGRPEFGDRGLTLLKLLLPAFKAGVREVVRSMCQRESVTNHLDSLREGIRLYDLNGEPVYQNPAFSAILDGESDAEKLEVAISAAVQALLKVSEDAAPAPRRRESQEVHSTTYSYRVSGNLLGQELLCAERRIAISLSLVAPDTALSDKALQQRFKLTVRELEITRRLAHGQSTKEVAEAIGISLHTARRHTERIFSKLGIRSRSQIGPRLRSR